MHSILFLFPQSNNTEETGEIHSECTFAFLLDLCFFFFIYMLCLLQVLTYLALQIPQLYVFCKSSFALLQSQTAQL